MSGEKISDRMSGAMDHGFYATIRAVANHLGVSYRTAQKALRRDFLAGDLRREWVGRRLVYTSCQLSMFGAARTSGKRAVPSSPEHRAKRKKIEEDQGQLF